MCERVDLVLHAAARLLAGGEASSAKVLAETPVSATHVGVRGRLLAHIALALGDLPRAAELAQAHGDLVLAGLALRRLGQLDAATTCLRAAVDGAGDELARLRALAAHYIPSALERKFDFAVFSPLRHTLAIMLELEKQTGESRLNFVEMAIVVQLTSSDEPLADIVAQVLALRARRLASPNKRKFDRQEREAAAVLHGYAAGTFNDYADTNLRYLKATGLVQSKGRGLSLVPEKHVFVEKLIQDTGIPDSDRSYFITLCNGAKLPTDNKDSALAVLDDLLPVSYTHLTLPTSDLV